VLDINAGEASVVLLVVEAAASSLKTFLILSSLSLM
jgi:hypothetical protein